MTTVTTKAVAKVAAVATGLAMATSMLSLAPLAHAALTDTQVQSILSLLSSFGADSTTIANVQASLTGGTPVSTGGSTSSSCSFTKDLTVGATGSEVTCLQSALIAGGYSIPAGATGYFGAQTVAAVSAWQKAAGVSPTAGYFGAKSRAAFNLGGGSTTTTTGPSAGTGTGLKVSLSPTSPNGSVLVQGQGIGNLGDFVFANPTSAPINVTGLTFNRTGVSNDSTMVNVYLYNGGTRITDSAGVSASAFSYSDTNGLFTVPAGQTYTVSVRSDIAGSTSGQQIGVKLVSVTSNGTLDASVSFPVNGGYQTISAADLADVVFQAAAPSGTLPTTNPSLSPANDVLVWQNTVAVSTNPVKLSSIRLTNLGSIDSTNVINLRLYVDGTMVGSAVPMMGADRTVTFDLSASPALLTTQSHIVKVLANITGGSSRTLQLSVQRSSDAMFVDNQLNQPVTLNTTNTGTNFSAATSGLQTIAAVTSSSGVSVSTDPTSPNQAVAVGATNVKWATFAMLASGENVKVSDLYVVADTSVHNGGLDNGKIMVNGVQIGSTKDIVDGTSGTTYGSAADFSLGSSLILPAGQTTLVDVYADANTSTSTNLSNNETVRVYLAAGSSNAQGQSSLVSTSVPSSGGTGGNLMIVSTSTLTPSKSTTYGDQTILPGSNNAKLGSFALSTGATEGVTVNTIAISMTAANAASITNLTLKDHATGGLIPGSSVITTPSGSAISAGQNNNSFNVSLSIPASSSKTIDIYANVLSSANAGLITMQVDTGTTGMGSLTSQSTPVSGEVALQAITIGTGTLSVTNGAGDPVSNNILAGAGAVNVGQFNFAASNSSYTVQNLAILVPYTEANDVTNVTVSYKDFNGTTVVSPAQALVNTGTGNATATFSGLTMYVPSNDSTNLDVSIGTPTISSGALSGEGVKVSLDMGATSGTFRAVDTAGTATTSLNGGTAVAAGGTFYVRKSIPTLAMVPTGITVPATGSPLYKFSITADPAGAIEWTQVAFNISTSSATVTNIYLTDDATGVSLLDSSGGNQYASTSQTIATTTLLYNTGTKYAQVSGTKTYDLYGTVTGFTTGSSITISLASDSTNAGLGTASAKLGGKTVWSDRSATSHTTGTSDWTNGYLLKNFTSSAITYSK